MTKHTDSNADPENDAEPDEDTIAANTDIQGRFAYYTGTEDISSNWSITEKWVRDTAYAALDAWTFTHCDTANLMGGEIEIKGTRIRHADGEPGKYVIRRHQHDILCERADRGADTNYYRFVVQRRLAPNCIYMVADTTISVDDMPDILADYSWCEHHRNGNVVEDIHIPWPAIPGFDRETIEHRAHLLDHLHQIVTGYDADTVRAVLTDLEDLVAVLDKYDELPEPPMPPVS